MRCDPAPQDTAPSHSHHKKIPTLPLAHGSSRTGLEHTIQPAPHSIFATTRTLPYDFRRASHHHHSENNANPPSASVYSNSGCEGYNRTRPRTVDGTTCTLPPRSYPHSSWPHILKILLHHTAITKPHQPFSPAAHVHSRTGLEHTFEPAPHSFLGTTRTLPPASRRSSHHDHSQKTITLPPLPSIRAPAI